MSNVDRNIVGRLRVTAGFIIGFGFLLIAATAFTHLVSFLGLPTSDAVLRPRVLGILGVSLVGFISIHCPARLGRYVHLTLLYGAELRPISRTALSGDEEDCGSVIDAYLAGVHSNAGP